MFPTMALLMVAAQPGAPALPSVFPIPPGLRIKEGSLAVQPFDLETFEVRLSAQQGPVRVPVEGRVWRFKLEGDGVRQGALRLLQTLRPALEAAGWQWQWAERGVARLNLEDRSLWVRLSAGATGEVAVVLAEPAPPPVLELRRPGPTVEYPKPDGDFPYLTPWPGARLVRSEPTQAPVATTVAEGREGFVLVTFIEKEYVLSEPLSPHAFLTVYRKALETAGWEIDGNYKGILVQLQASYQREGRDLRAILRLAGDALAISVADIGAQRPR